MNDADHGSEGLLRWLLNLPAVPRLVVLGLCGLWWIYFTIGAYIESLQNPGQVWWLHLWNGSLGGNSFSAFGATVLSLYLTSEVITMILTLLGNRRRILDAAKKAAAESDAKAAQARQEGISIGRQEGLQEGVAIGRKEGLDEGVAIGRHEGLDEGLAKGRQQMSQEVAEWYHSAKEDWAAGCDPGPPPTFDENGNNPA